MTREQSEFACGVLLMLTFAVLLRIALGLWVDCGKPCGAAGKEQPTTEQRSGAR